MSNGQQRSGNSPVPDTRRKAVPIALAMGTAEYTPGQQELPVRLTSLAEMVQCAQNWSRSRSIWPIGYGLACCAIEMIASASVVGPASSYTKDMSREMTAKREAPLIVKQMAVQSDLS